MPSSPSPKNFQDILRQRQQSSFVGRKDQLDLFRQNLTYSPEDARRYFVFNPWGQGGVGKTTLLRQFREIARSQGGITAYIDEGERDIPGVMARFARDLAQQGYELPEFSKRYRLYRQKQEELEADPEAPQGFSALIGRTMAKTAVKLGRQVPGAGVAFDLVDEEAVATQAGEWATFVAKKLGNKDEVHLIRDPVAVLTPLFLQDWGRVASQVDVVLIFDTYERTGEFLDDWLRDVLQGSYGEVPINFLWVMAGREELNRNRWATYEGIMIRLPLEPFSEAEAQQYLASKGVTDPGTVAMILNLSGCLPLLVATLAEGTPDHPDQVGDASDTAVARFLKWESDPQRRQVALDAALPRSLNQDIIAQLRPDDGADELFVWLKQKPFVRERTDGWAYHDVVRAQMLRHKRLTSPQSWAYLHGKLADYYQAQCGALALEENDRYTDLTWQVHQLNGMYHRLCQAPQKQLPIVLNEFLVALKNKRTFAERWADVMVQAGKDSEMTAIEYWGHQLAGGLKAYSKDRYDKTLAMFTALINCREIAPQWQPIAFGWRGKTYRLMELYENALDDFNRAIELDPEYQWAMTERSLTHWITGSYEKALQDSNRAIQLNPEYDWAIANRGKTYQLMKRYEKALQDFTRVIELDSKFELVLAERGKTYQLMKRYEEALQDFTRAIELNPEYQWAIAQRGQTYRYMERYEEALQDFTRAIELNPEYQWAIAHRGQTYRLMARYEESLQDFTRAIELNPEYQWAIAQRGQTYRYMERYEDALQDFTRVIELVPKYDWAIAQRGQTYQLMERYEEALQDFTRAIELVPKYDWAIAHRGQTYQLMERYDEALQDFTRAIELVPKYDWAIAHRGKTYQLMERYDEALQDFTRAIELDPKYDWAIANCCLTYLLSGQYHEAIENCNLALELDSKNPHCLLIRGTVYKVLQQLEFAEADFSAAIQLTQAEYEKDPSDGHNIFPLALCHLAAGNEEQAKRYYRDALHCQASRQSIQDAIQDLKTFLKIFPDHRLARQARQVLQKALQNRSG
ncbi:tetratricopeptide repeat protein [Leptolyngbya iicbica]|uniref:Tetratricopeptide repeat protein n=1 Tax=Leptolyngbya iicbica LK TaxID=2294035 RepID=A0A4Q7E171_9CYAN|nr:tetratricopeptide repeat protein [Leptolyngbya sp. LK]RZM74685.1 tetratricopeptide repeat protein [Leptolyngbya sp. LK]